MAASKQARGRRHWQSKCLSYPKIISARNDDVIRTEPVWRRRSRIARRLAPAARPCPTPDVCASHYNRPSTRSAPAANAVRQRSGRDPSSRAEASRSGVQHRGSARATSVRSGGPVSPWPGPDLRKSARRHRHCRAPNSSAPYPREMPLPSAAPAIRRSGAA